MAGASLRIIPIQKFDTGGILPINSTATVYTVRRIHAARWRDVVLLARLHVVGAWPTGSQVVFQVAPDAYTNDDPSQAWNVPTAVVLVPFAQGIDTAPSVRTGSVLQVLGHVPPLLQIRIQLITGPGNAGQIAVTLSADLNLKGE